jgi:hypothetical protein
MSASVRVRLIVALVALAAAGTAVGVTLATRTDVAEQTSKPPPYAADPTARPEIARAVQERCEPGPPGRYGGCGSSPSAIRGAASSGSSSGWRSS